VSLQSAIDRVGATSYTAARARATCRRIDLGEKMDEYAEGGAPVRVRRSIRPSYRPFRAATGRYTVGTARSGR
jgi:hypothetical protein